MIKKIFCIGLILCSSSAIWAQKTNHKEKSNDVNSLSSERWYTEGNVFLGVSFTDIFKGNDYTPANAAQFDTARRAANNSAHAGYSTSYKVTPQFGIMATTTLNSFLALDWGVKYRRFTMENTTNFDSVEKYKDYIPVDNRVTYINYGFQNVNAELGLRFLYKNFSGYAGVSVVMSSKTEGTKHLYPTNEVRTVTTRWKMFNSEGKFVPRPYLGLQYRFFSTDEYRFYVYLSNEWVTRNDYESTLGIKWCFSHTGKKSDQKKSYSKPTKRMDY